MKIKSTDISYACGFEIIGLFLEWSKAERKRPWKMLFKTKMAKFVRKGKVGKIESERKMEESKR